METTRSYENFPIRLVAVVVLVTVSTYAIGAFILAGFGALMTALYLLFCLGHELRVMNVSCVDCYYYGRWCAFGRGKAAALFFKRGDPERFPAKTISLKELTSDVLVVIFPLAGGTVLLIRDFSGAVVVALAAFLTLSLGGTYLIRSRIACACCRQRELGCPAEQFFSKRLS